MDPASFEGNASNGCVSLGLDDRSSSCYIEQRTKYKLDLVPRNTVKHKTLQAACALHWVQPLILAPLVRLLCASDYMREEDTACT
jgi:hypothetical protein